MPTDHRAVLASIKRFDQLIAYLRDEMGWPIARDSFEDVDDLFYDFTADELGIDPKTAAKIESIKRLRPLSPRQPWGIFFVKFEPKKLPVVALRRILSQVALKKRASANSAERTAWAADDLLFVSNYGEGDERQISFAHFSQDRTKADLPILKVLGWNDRDTALHLDGVATELATKLSWPEDESNVDRWREKWRSAFTLRPDEVIKTSKTLAVELAKLARRIRDRIRTVLAIETKNGPVTKLMKAFQEALVHDLDPDGFADMYAQTIAYGLLSARVTNPKANTADGFAAQLPVTNPFLKELMETFLHVGGRKGKAGRGPGIDFDELGVSEVVELLDNAKMEEVVRDFGDRNPQEDPVIHFYELFLKEYDAKKRMQRGVFYTPRPVVSYIVRSVHELLQTEFGLPDGLADMATWGEMAKRHAGLSIPDGVNPTDRFVTVLDPATGTGTFLVEAIEIIHRTLVEKWKREGHGEKKILDLWNDYVPRQLLPRLHGYELLMAPYAIAHLKIGLKLHETGYRFQSDERARVYLTNALEPAQDFSGTLAFAIPALAHEAEAVNEVKRAARFTVVLGNPPYSKLSANLSVRTRSLVDSYKFIAGERIKEKGALQFEMNLQDDYIKFLRLSEQAIGGPAAGIAGLITNSGYLGNPTLRGVRWSIGQTYSRIGILDLHGHQASPIDGDENVFDILQGVAVSLMSRVPGHQGFAEVRYSSLSGGRPAKYGTLVASTWGDLRAELLAPEAPLYKFTPEDTSLRSEFDGMLALPEVFSRNSAGFISSRDRLVIDSSRKALAERIRAFGSDHRSEDEIYEAYGFEESKRLNLRIAQAVVRRDEAIDTSIISCLYRPFDARWVYYKRELIESYKPIAREMQAGNSVALIATRQVTRNQFEHAFVSRVMIEIKACSHDRNTQIFPLLLRGDEDGQTLQLQNYPVANLSADMTSRLARSTGRRCSWTTDRSRGGVIVPEEVLGYVYAILYSESYRRRYFESLRSEFPRCPFNVGLELFSRLSELGRALVALHLVEAPAQQALSVRYDKAKQAWHYEIARGQRIPVTLSFNGSAKSVVGKVGWSHNTVWIDAFKPKKGAADAKVTGTIGFNGVSEGIWNFHIGGYQVCEKWLKDRKGRTLSADDIAHYHRIVIALHETLRLMREIDEVIEEHGGWPGAFQGADASEQPTERVE